MWNNETLFKMFAAAMASSVALTPVVAVAEIGPEDNMADTFQDDLYNLVVTLRYPDDQPSAGSSSAANEIAEELGA